MKISVVCARALMVVACAAIGLACSDGSSNQASNAAYRDAGPFVAGVTTVDLGDRQAEVWYPVDPGSEGSRARDVYFIRDWLPEALDDFLPPEINPPFETNAYRDAPASGDGPFPLVVFAHGFAAFRDQSTVLTAHLATWGFVVVSADYLERGLRSVLGEPPAVRRGDVEVSRAAVDAVKAENARTGSLLFGRVATDRVAITGHSAGGGSSVLFAAESDVIAFVPLSAGRRADSTTLYPEKPVLFLTGRDDGVALLAGIEAAYAAAAPPKRLVVIDRAGHLAPSDLCAIGENGGGIVAIALEAGLPVPENLQRLGTDGCQPGALLPRDGWPVVNHFVTAQLRHAFGIDEEPVGLSAEVAAGFPEATFSYQEQLE